jgi:DNA topoisomerase I
MLIIVESPAKAKTISKIVGSKHIVKASIGHIRKISDLKKTQDNRKLEINGIDIEQNFGVIYEVDPAKKDVVSELKKLAKNTKDGILFATDSDREGEAISWHLSEILGIKDKHSIQRLEFHEITKTAIEHAIKHPRKLNLELVHAQQARQVLDKLVGYKLSPVLWNTMGNFHLSAGRVQSPALALVCLREKEILSFVAKEYWYIHGVFSKYDSNKELAKETINLSTKENIKTTKHDESSFTSHLLKLKATHLGGNKLEEINERSTLESLTSGLKAETQFIITDVSSKKEYTRTRAPWTTSSLQQGASSRFGFSPKLTMQLAQRLYEGIEIDGNPTALITYMRTDSVSLSQESIASARTYISNTYPQFLPEKPKYYKSKSRNSQEAHEAIRPINPLLEPKKLAGKIDPRQLKLYTLIWERMIECQMIDEEKERVTFVVKNSRNDSFQGSIAWTTVPGCKILTPEKIIPKVDIHFEQGQKLSLDELIYDQHFTSPPSRYSAASLVKKLEELGIGRPSTYASIISTLQDREYVEKGTSSMKPSTLGMKIFEILSQNFADITGSDMTAKMEEHLDEISRGEKEYLDVLRQFWFPFKEEVDSKSAQIVESKDRYRSSETDVECPKCNSKMELKIGRFGEYFQCSTTAEHKFPKNFREYEAALVQAVSEFSHQTDGKECEECGKSLIVRVSKSSLNAYIACPDYQVGNKHTVMNVNFGDCPKCAEEGRKGKKAGVLVKKSYRGRSYIACSLDKKICGYTEKITQKKGVQ